MSYAKKPLPPGWTTRVDQKGRTYFVSHVSRTTTYTDPRIAIYGDDSHRQPPTVSNPYAIKSGPQPPSTGYATSSSHGPSPYPSSSSAPLSRVGHSSSADSVKRQAPLSTVERKARTREYIKQHETYNHMPLPPNWEVRYDSTGRPYYVDHSRRSTTYEDPRPEYYQNNPPPALSGPPAQPTHTFASTSSGGSHNSNNSAPHPPPSPQIPHNQHFPQYPQQNTGFNAFNSYNPSAYHNHNFPQQPQHQQQNSLNLPSQYPPQQNSFSPQNSINSQNSFGSQNQFNAQHSFNSQNSHDSFNNSHNNNFGFSNTNIAVKQEWSSGSTGFNHIEAAPQNVGVQGPAPFDPSSLIDQALQFRSSHNAQPVAPPSSIPNAPPVKELAHAIQNLTHHDDVREHLEKIEEVHSFDRDHLKEIHHLREKWDNKIGSVHLSPEDIHGKLRKASFGNLTGVTWSKRYCSFEKVGKDYYLCYSKSKSGSKKKIWLTEARCTEVPVYSIGRPNVISIRPGGEDTHKEREYYFEADTADEMHKWVSVINNAIEGG